MEKRMARTYDSNRLKKVYPFIRRPPKPIAYETSGYQIETASINFVNEDSKTYSFQKTYTTAPICIITPKGENINAYISSVTITNITIKTSAAFTGSIELHAYESISLQW